MSSALAAIIFTATLIAIVLRPWKISEAWSAGAGAALMVVTGAVGFQGGLDIHTALLLQSLDGASTLRQVVRKVGSSLELSRDETSAFSETAIAMAKRLYQLGFLVRSKS
jgi:Na+/H+ antiporter NhaD/arsenite permease-like protein